MNQKFKNIIKEWNEVDLIEFVNPITNTISFKRIGDWWENKINEYIEELIKEIIPKRNNCISDDIYIQEQIDSYNCAIDMIWDNYNNFKKGEK